MIVPSEPVSGGSFLVCTKVIDRVFKDSRPRCIGSVVYDLFHPCIEGGAVVLVVGGAEGSEDSEGADKGLCVGEGGQKFGFPCENFLFASLKVGEDAIDGMIDVFSTCVFVSEEFGEVVDIECAVGDCR